MTKDRSRRRSRRRLLAHDLDIDCHNKDVAFLSKRERLLRERYVDNDRSSKKKDSTDEFGHVVDGPTTHGVFYCRRCGFVLFSSLGRTSRADLPCSGPIEG